MPSYTPPARPSIRLVRSSPYKGGTRQWSNRFFFTGPDWTDATFNSMCDQLRDDWKGMLLARSSIIEYFGYDAGSDVPVKTRTATTAGTYSPGVGVLPPLETCIVAKLTTDQRTSKNHPIYGFKYIHDVHSQGDSGPELPLDGQKSGVDSRLTSYISGINDTVNDRHLCTARGAVFLDCSVLTYLSHRDFPNL